MMEAVRPEVSEDSEYDCYADCTEEGKENSSIGTVKEIGNDNE